MKISVARALLILLDKYKGVKGKEAVFNSLKALYLSGASDPDKLRLIQAHLKDEALKPYVISSEPEDINDDDTRRYFETQLAYETVNAEIGHLTLDELEAYVEMMEQFAPERKEHWDKIFKIQASNVRNKLLRITDKEGQYGDFIYRLANREIFADLLLEDRIKVKLIASTAYIAVHLTYFNSQLFPLDLYLKGIFSAAERGKILKSNQESTTSSSYGLLKPHSPLPADDVARTSHAREDEELESVSYPPYFNYLKPSLLSTFDPDAKGVKDLFLRLVHPFSNAVSGTMLAQIRVLAALKHRLNEKKQEKLEQIPNCSEKLETFIKLFVTSLLFYAGGHSLYEFLIPFELPEIQAEFADIPGFKEHVNLEYLFLTSNQTAFDKALEKAIQYNRQILKRDSLHEAIKFPNQVDESVFSELIKDNFKSIKGSTLAKRCFDLAEELLYIDLDSKFEDKIDEMILALSQGDLKKTQSLIQEVKTYMGKGVEFYTPYQPALKAIGEFEAKINAALGDQQEPEVKVHFQA